MNDHNIDKTEEETLLDEVSDEALEIAAGAGRMAGMAGEHALETIADTSGGAVYFPGEITQLDEMFDLIDRELRTQYRLGYYPDPRPPQGAYRQIEVRVKGDYTVRYRKAYYAGGVAN